MSSSDIVRAQPDGDTKASASGERAAKAPLVSDEERLRFEVSGPNAETREAIVELEAGKGRHFANAEALFDDLGI